MRRTHNWVLMYHFYLGDNKMDSKSNGVPISLQMSTLYLLCDDAYTVATEDFLSLFCNITTAFDEKINISVVFMALQTDLFIVFVT